MGKLFARMRKSVKEKVHPHCAAIVPAAGKSARMGGEDKMFSQLCGVPVLAHTKQYHYPEPELIELIETAKALGIRALAAYYSEFSAEQTAWLLRAAEKYGMGVSGGSDYHGTRKTHISMGTGCGNLAIPYSVLEELKKLR